MCGNGCVRECLDNAIVVRRFWTVEKPGELLKMLEYVLNTFTNVFCQYCSRSLGEKASDVEKSWGASAKLPSSPITTLDSKRTSKGRHHVW